jgi:hypothetical protein
MLLKIFSPCITNKLLVWALDQRFGWLHAGAVLCVWEHRAHYATYCTWNVVGIQFLYCTKTLFQLPPTTVRGLLSSSL